MEGAVIQSAKNPSHTPQVNQTDETYTITPFESVSLNASQIWNDNRHRAYFSPSIGNLDGFLLFDVTQIPDNAQIVSMTLRGNLENAFGSPYANPIVDIYYSGDDNWTRSTVQPGSLSLDVLLTDNVPFSSYEPYHDFTLNVSAHNWSQDLLDNRICIGFKDDVTYYSYVYFYGAYGDPSGPAPQLTIVTSGGVASWDVNTSPVNPPVIIPANGGSFPYNINVHNLGTTPGTISLWNKVRDASNLYTNVFGPVTRTLPGGANPSRIFNQTIAGTISSGTLYFISYVGTYPNTIADSSFFTITKSAVADGNPWIGESYVTGDLFDEFVTVNNATPTKSMLVQNYPNPFNPTTTIRFDLPQAAQVTLDVFDINGRAVGVQHVEPLQSGSHEITFDGSGLPSGVYLYKLQAGDYSAVSKMVLLK
ncbi:MAG: T9SS type A sorting domain-containing protein [bacterium]|nr:T9SS type A sorting domain-containing protein [bacterium]